MEKMDAAEYTAISLFFDKDMRNILLSKHAVEDPVGLHNQVYGNFPENFECRLIHQPDYSVP